MEFNKPVSNPMMVGSIELLKAHLIGYEFQNPSSLSNL